MALITKQPTSNTTPDATLGGLAVTTPSNTGHASTVTSASGAGGSGEKSCLWSGFTAASGTIVSVTLKIDHLSAGSITGGSSNSLLLEYSLNAGGSWTTAVTRSNFTASQGTSTFSASLSVGQTLSDVRVRVDYLCDSNDPGDAASITATISNIRIEVVTSGSGSPVLAMM
jgi:hypothetical protein